MAEQNIFVSYSRSDADFVVKLATELKKAGANLWLDQLDIPFGAMWDVEIEKALVSCSSLLFIVSKSSVSSNNVLNEVYYALEGAKKVLPVKINDCTLPFRINRLQYIDLSTNYDSGFVQLLRTLNLSTQPEPKPVKEPEDEEQAWERAKSGNTIYSIEKYLDRFPDGNYKKEALRIIEKITKNEIEGENRKAEQVLWTAAVNKNTIASYQNYLSHTELGSHIDEANSAIVKLQKKIEEDSENQLWQKAEKKNTIVEYEDYLIHHPSGRYAELAETKITSLKNSSEESLWNEAKNSNTISSFQQYINDTKLKKYEKEANLSIQKLQNIAKEESFWQKVKKENTISAFQEYRFLYKNGMHIEEALLAIKKFEEQEPSKKDSFIQPPDARIPVQPPVPPFVETKKAKQAGKQLPQFVKEIKKNKKLILLIISVIFIAVLLVVFFSDKKPDDAFSSNRSTSDTSTVVASGTSLAGTTGDSPKRSQDLPLVVTADDPPKRAQSTKELKGTKDTVTKHKLKTIDSPLVSITPDPPKGPKPTPGDTVVKITEAPKGDSVDKVRELPKPRGTEASYINSGNAKHRSEDYSGAIKDYTTALEINEKNATTYYNRAVSKNSLGDYAGVIVDASKAIELKQGYAEAYNYRGNAKTALKYYEGAIKDYTEAINLKPTGMYYYNRGVAKIKNDDKNGGCKDLKKSCDDYHYAKGCDENRAICK